MRTHRNNMYIRVDLVQMLKGYIFIKKNAYSIDTQFFIGQLLKH